MIGKTGLREVDDINHRRAARTYEGMASWAGGGTFGACCSECVYWAANRKKRPKPTERGECGKYQQRMGKLSAPAVPGEASACSLFEKRAQD